MVKNFDAIDAAIVLAITNQGRRRLSEIWREKGVQDASRGAAERYRGGIERLVDSRLQKMRRGGLLAYSSKDGWRDVPVSED